MTNAVEEVKEVTEEAKVFSQITIAETDKGLQIKAENYEHNAQLVYMLNTAAVRIMEDMFKSESEDTPKED